MGLLNKKNINQLDDKESDDIYKTAFDAAVSIGDYRNLFKNCKKLWEIKNENSGEAVYIFEKSDS